MLLHADFTPSTIRGEMNRKLTKPKPFPVVKKKKNGFDWESRFNFYQGGILRAFIFCFLNMKNVVSRDWDFGNDKFLKFK